MALGVGDDVLADGVPAVIVRTSRLGGDSLINLPRQGLRWYVHEMLTDKCGDATVIRRPAPRLAVILRRWTRERHRRRAYRAWFDDGCRGSASDYLEG